MTGDEDGSAERLNDLWDGHEASRRVLARRGNTLDRRDGGIGDTKRMMMRRVSRVRGVSRHRAHLMGLVGLTDNSTHSRHDWRSDKDGREDPRREASNHQMASIANFFMSGPEQCLNNASGTPCASGSFTVAHVAVAARFRRLTRN